MNKEDIIRMAQEAKFATEEWGDGLHHICVYNFQGSETEITEELQRFAALVASAEREACANAMAQIVMTPTLTHGALVKLSDVVNAIRARGQA